MKDRRSDAVKAENKRNRRRVERTECPVHAFQKHGREAEELRARLEELLIGATDDTTTVGEMANEIQLILDVVDARDSLAYVERKNPRD